MTDEQVVLEALHGYCTDNPDWLTDALAALDRLVARAATAERRLRDAPLGGDGSHWDGCWRSHIDCAVARAETAERERDEARAKNEELGMEMYENCVSKKDANEAVAQAQELALKLGREQYARADAAEARVAALEAALRECRELFTELRGDWSDNRGPCREGFRIIDAALAQPAEEGTA